MADRPPPETILPSDENPLDSEGRPVFAEDGTDLSLIREFLALTPTERLRALQSMVDLVENAKAKATTKK